MRRLRVALVHPFTWPEVLRGGERYLDDLAWYLAGAGHEVDVLTGGPRSSVEHRPDGVRVRRLRHAAVPTLERRRITPMETFGARALPSLLRRRYDVVQALTPTGAIASRAAGQRTVFLYLGHPVPEQFARRPWLRRSVRAAVQAATVTAAYSAASAAAVERLFGGTCAVLTPGVRVGTFTPRREAPAGPARVLFPSDASDRRKGLDVALRALALLLERDPGARLQLSGSGDHRWALAKLGADRDRVAAALDDLGPGTDDLPDRYRAATVTVLPSYAEAFGIVLVESLACGTPVVCSADGGMVEIVDRSDVGCTAPYGDAGALADALDRAVALARDPATPTRCAEHARRWDWTTSVGPAHEALYERIAGT